MNDAIVPNSLPTNVYGPITAGQMFERTFRLLRENFKLFFGIVLILIGAEVVIGGVLGGSAFWMGRSTSDAAPIGRLLLVLPEVLVGIVLLVILVQIIHGALFIATRARLAQTTMTVGEACKPAAEKAGRLIGIALLILVRTIGYLLLFYVATAVLALIVALMFGGLSHVAGGFSFHHGHLPSAGLIVLFALLVLAWIACYFFILLWLWARYLLSIPAALEENLSVTEAIRRSIYLSRGSKGRMYALAFGMFGVYVVLFAVTFPIQLMVTHPFNAHVGISGGIAGVTMLLLSIFRILISSVIVAFIGIATALCYYDLRVRKEGFGVVLPPSVVPAPPAESWPVPPDVPTSDLPIS